MIASDYALKELKAIEMPVFNSEQLRFMAFNGDFNSVYSMITRISTEERKKISDKYILFETITGSINKLNELKTKHEEFLVSKERKFLLEILDEFILVCKQTSNFPRHLFHSLLKVSYELVQLSEFHLAINYLNGALRCGAEKFPDIKTEVLFRLADVYNRQGDLVTSSNYVNQLINHPYFITDRNRISELIFNASQIYLKQGNVEKYKTLLFLGLRYFYTNPDNRRKSYDENGNLDTLITQYWNGTEWVTTFRVFHTWLPVTSVETNDPASPPLAFSLEQNYPNPFNPSTTIHFIIPDNGFLTLKIYDVLGNEVVTLVNEEKSEGSYKVEFNAVGLTSGIYFYQLKLGSFTETKKMMLMK